MLVGGRAGRNQTQILLGQVEQEAADAGNRARLGRLQGRRSVFGQFSGEMIAVVFQLAAVTRLAGIGLDQHRPLVLEDQFDEQQLLRTEGLEGAGQDARGQDRKAIDLAAMRSR